MSIFWIALNVGLAFYVASAQSSTCNQPNSLQCDYSALYSLIQPNWKYPSSWQQSSDPCSSWEGVSCSSNPERVTGISITGFVGSVPNELSEINNLQKFELLNTELNGTLPAALSTLTKMEQFIVSLSELYSTASGILPPSYYTWTNLEHLQLQCPTYHAFWGSLPQSWSTWTNVKYLQISGCMKSGGSIPPQWTTFNNLIHLDLSFNNLTGSLPQGLSNAEYMEYLNVAHNQQMKSSIPAQYSVFQSMTYFNVANNMLTGTLPSSFSSWIQLSNFSIFANQLQGSFHRGFKEWEDIVFFDASRNYFTGTLPKEWSSWGNLTEFKIAYNLVSGKMPSEWAHAWNLSSFDISQNKRLCGDVAEKFVGIGGVHAIEGTNINSWCTGQLQPVSWEIVLTSALIGLVVLAVIIAIPIICFSVKRRSSHEPVPSRRVRRPRSRRFRPPDGQGDYESLPYEPPIVIQSSQAPPAY